MHKARSSFTIVELLIVIVVIAILAAISIVAYNGIQTRANNTQTIDATKQFIKAYNLYALDNGDYPQLVGCLGESYPGNRCMAQNPAVEVICWGTGQASTNAAIGTALKQYMGGSVPSPSTQQAACNGTTYVGSYASYQSATKTVNILMILRGDQACPPMSPNASVPTKAFSGDATRCFYTLAAI